VRDRGWKGRTMPFLPVLLALFSTTASSILVSDFSSKLLCYCLNTENLHSNRLITILELKDLPGELFCVCDWMNSSAVEAFRSCNFSWDKPAWSFLNAAKATYAMIQNYLVVRVNITAQNERWICTYDWDSVAPRRREN
jgi:hypothetical protein